MIKWIVRLILAFILSIVLAIVLSTKARGEILPDCVYETDNMVGKTIQWGFIQNEWISLHFIAGGIIGRLINDHKIIYLSPEKAVLITTGIGIGWEVLEAIVESTLTKRGQIHRYGSVERYWFDTGGDVIAVGLGSLVATRYIPQIRIKRNNIVLFWSIK